MHKNVENDYLRAHICAAIFKMLKALTISIAILFFGLSTSNGWVMVWFGANQSSIIAEFCENKQKPELECNGKCHLAKTLNKANFPAEDFPMEKLVSHDFKWGLPQGFTILYSEWQNTLNSNLYFYNNLYRFSNFNKLLRPPNLA